LVRPIVSVRAVIFDYYETLAQLTTDLRERAFDVLAERLGVDLPPGEAYRQWRELTPNWSLASLRQPMDGETVFSTFKSMWLERSTKLFANWGASELPDIGAGAYARAHAEARVYPDVRPALDTLRPRYRLAVLSDADSDFLNASVERNSLSFDAVVSSEGVGAYKPHISMFRAVCERLDVVPEEAAYVGDSPWADVCGARNAGMRSVWINRHGATWPDEHEPPDTAIQSLDGLPGTLS
jgi:putative hydrolase of the HAD superfamily